MATELYDIQDTFASRGLRCTLQRRVLFEELAKSRSHPTADELFETVRERVPAISLATVYNALHVFTDHGLCRRVPGSRSNGGCRYDADVSDHVHVTFPDGTTRDAPTYLSERIVRSIPHYLIEELEREMGVELGRLSVHLESGPADGNDAGNGSYR